MKLTTDDTKPPANLFGTYETLEYIDTAFMLIKHSLPSAKKVATIFNQSEPQSVNALKRLENLCGENNIELLSRGVSSSNETQLATASLMQNQPDAFFALPDNVVFSSMEVIVKTCDEARIPVFTSEEGLVKRGAVAAFGADMYQWGYQTGMQAAKYLTAHSTKDLVPEPVKVRRKVFNAEKAKQFSLTFDSTYTAVTK
jgi:putative ABC transport system substrate-binding protein